MQTADTTAPADAGTGLYAPRKFTKRTRQRFWRDRTAELLRHLGRPPSFPERLLIGRLVALEWQLRRIDARVEAGDELSGHALRARLAAENRLRLDLQALGLRPPPEPPGAAYARHMAQLEAEQAERERQKREQGEHDAVAASGATS